MVEPRGLCWARASLDAGCVLVFIAPSSRRDVAHSRDAFLRLHRACDTFDRRLSPHPMRGIIPPTSYALSGDQPIDGFPRFLGKGLRTFDLGHETLELGNVLDVPAGRTHENSDKPNDEHCDTAPARQHRTVIDGNAHTGGIKAPRCARGGRDLFRDGSHVRLLDRSKMSRALSERRGSGLTAKRRSDATARCWTVMRELLKVFGSGTEMF
jgi:hypothetical protein